MTHSTRALTFAMLKPDVTDSGRFLEALDSIRQAGFVIAAARVAAPGSTLFEHFYGEHAGRPYFAGLVSAMSQGPIIALLMAAPGRDPITAWRQYLGATDPTKAAPGTLRARFGTAGPRNAGHGSDCPEAVVREARWFFTDAEVARAGALPVEIERKFVVSVAPEALDAGTTTVIRQGYIYTGDPEVRIREEEGIYTVTEKRGAGITRTEVQSLVSSTVGEALFSVAGPVVLQKRRTRLGRWEIDTYEGRLVGLRIAEIELTHETESLPDAPAGVTVVREVTADPTFKNQALARLSTVAAEQFVIRTRG
jgi:nucleoside-diphosphate kinase